MNREQEIWRLNNDYLFSYDIRPAGNLPKNLHSHRAYEIFILESGATTMLIGDKLFPITQGDILLVAPETIHANKGGIEHYRYAVHFTMSHLKKYFDETVCNEITNVIQNNKLTMKPGAFKRILEILGNMQTKFGGKYSYIHIAELLTIISDPSNHIASDRQTENKTVQSVMDYINFDYPSITSLDDIASHAHISKEYLCQLFKKETGITVSHYLNGVRIQNACEILKKGETNIMETAILCGYNSSMYFCKMFKSIVNMTPKEYRKISRS